MSKLSRTASGFARLIGFDANKTGHAEKFVSALGGLAGVLAVALLARTVHTGPDAALIVASMGASAVLLFAVPHGPLSQPWPVLGGHLIAAAIGISCGKFIADPAIAAGCTVGATILAMHYLRCMHPPGGGTALAMVVGRDSVALSYGYLLDPLLRDVALLLGAAVLFNFIFPWRRYPVGFAKWLNERGQPAATAASADDLPRRDDLTRALQTMNKVVYISEDELEEIFRTAQQHRLAANLKPDEIRLGHYYSNGRQDAGWQIRQVVDMPSAESADDLLIYKVVAGSERRSSAAVTRAEFARWARFEVFLNENSWQRLEDRSGDGRAG